MKKLTAQNSAFLARVKAQMNGKVYAKAFALVNDAGDIHAADAFIGSLFNDGARAKALSEMHAPKAMQVTEINLFALRSYLKGGGDAQPSATDRSFPNALHPVNAPHIRRCMKAGLVAPSADRSRLELTAAGCARLGIKEAV